MGLIHFTIIFPFNLYIPTGGDAYFNTLQSFDGGSSEWGMQVYFGHDTIGEGNIDGGGALAQLFEFEYDTWLDIRVEIDLDSDWGSFYLNNILIHGWVWSSGTFGTGTLNQLGGSNFYAWDGGVYANPNFYIDNYCFSCNAGLIDPPQNVTTEVINQNNVLLTWDPPEEDIPVGYNVYSNDILIDFVPYGGNLQHYFIELMPGSYLFCVSAIYDIGESMQACADEIYIPPSPPPAPTNLTGPECYFPGDTIHLTWEYNYLDGWIRWDDGTNTGNGIGTSNGAAFKCASRWYPDQLYYYDGLQLMEIEFYANGDPDATYVIKVWTGYDGDNEVLSQEVTSFVVDDWNSIVLDTPHTIDATERLWFGYEVTHTSGTYPAGCDDGPAITGNGDMIHTGMSWLTLSGLGFDFNWNLAAFVGLADGTKDFSHFNMYVKYPGSSFFVVIGPATSPFPFVPGEGGEYQFFVTAVWDPEGESLPSNIYSADLCTGVLNNTENNIEIFPNPASDIITIKSDFEIVSLKVYNPTGQTLAEKVINNNIYKFDVSQLNPGIYFLQIEFEDEQILKKIIIE